MLATTPTSLATVQKQARRQIVQAQRLLRAAQGLENGYLTVIPQSGDPAAKSDASQWLVVSRKPAGQEHYYLVAYSADAGWACDCPDHQHTPDVYCKHVQAVRLAIQYTFSTPI